MDSIEKYKDFTIRDFATDPSFIRWVKFGEEKADSFWLDFQEKYPEQSVNISKARTIVSELHILNHEMTGENVDRVWNEISRHVNETNASRKKSLIRRMRPLWAAASLALLLGLGYYLLENKPIENIVHQTPVHTDIAPGGNRAVLTLADGSQIILASAGHGLIAEEGSVKILKLKSGEIVYGDATSSSREIHYNTISTPRGGQYQITLPDGSKVWLNAESSLRYPTTFVGNKRKVELTGEGYFEVARNEKKPFYVSTGKMEIKVLGTHFNVNTYHDETYYKATLLEGKVEVTTLGKTVILKPGEQARLQVLSMELKISKNVDLDEVMAWKEGLFYFSDASIETVMKQLSKWYDVDVIYQGQMPDRVFRGGMQRSLTLSQALDLLGKNRINYEIKGKNLIIKP